MLIQSGITSPRSHSNAGKIYLFYSSARKKVKGKEQKILDVETSEFSEKVTQYSTWLQDQPMLTKITAVDLKSKKAKYHVVCRVKYQTEAESTLEGRKASLSVTFFHSPSLWYKERKTYAEELNTLKIYIEDGILGKKEVRLLVDINSYYLALLQDAVDTDLKHITSSPQKLEAKILKCCP